MANAWAFPVETDPLTGRIREAGGEDSVKQSIKLILSTRPGERYLYPYFGCDLQKFVFGLADYTTLKQIEKEVRNSILRWEPRIVSLEAQAASIDTTQIKLDIQYKISALDTEYHETHILELMPD